MQGIQYFLSQLDMVNGVPVNTQIIEVHSELGADGFFKTFHIPIIGGLVLIGVSFHCPINVRLSELVHVILQIFSVKDFLPLAVNRFPLFVHDIVIF